MLYRSWNAIIPKRMESTISKRESWEIQDSEANYEFAVKQVKGATQMLEERKATCKKCHYYHAYLCKRFPQYTLRDGNDWCGEFKFNKEIALKQKDNPGATS